MKRLTWILGLGALAACHEHDLGSGVNTLERDYARPAADTWKAAVKSVESAGLKILSDPADQFGGDLAARRPNGDEVRVRVKSLNETRSRVSVRVEPGDRELARQLHERIAGNVGLGEATTGLFGGDSLKGDYTAPLAACLETSKRVFGILKAETVSAESHATWARIDGRGAGSVPLRIHMERADGAKTSVEFVVGTSKSEDNKAFVRRMKEEFESRLRPE
jgi:hypothetical protein